MKIRIVRQTVTLQASPHQVYETLMDARKHSRLTGAKAKIDRKGGGKFTAFSGQIKGYTLEGLSDRKIVQLWRAEHWPKGHYSTATFSLRNEKGGTRLTLLQKDVPNQPGGHAKSKAPAETQAGQVFRLRNKGIRPVRGSVTGDLYCHVAVETPVKLTARQKELLREFEAINEKNPESHTPPAKSFFDRVRDFFGS